MEKRNYLYIMFDINIYETLKKKKKKKKPNSVAWVREWTLPTKQPPLVGKLVPTFADRECHVVSVMDPYSRIIGVMTNINIQSWWYYKKLIKLKFVLWYS
jgi:CBS-domain-containing membrane protein